MMTGYLPTIRFALFTKIVRNLEFTERVSHRTYERLAKISAHLRLTPPLRPKQQGMQLSQHIVDFVGSMFNGRESDDQICTVAIRT